MKRTILEELLLADGIKLREGGGSDKMVLCWAHEEKTPSMSVNVAKGVYNCHGCGAKGNAYQYLTDYKGLSAKEAMERLKEFGATDTFIDATRQQGEDAQAQHKRLPKTAREPYKHVNDKKGKRTAIYEYVGEGGELVFYVGRYEEHREGGKPKKTFLPFTPRVMGGFWVAAPRNEQIPDADRRPTYPLYRLQHLIAKIDAEIDLPQAAWKQVWVVEGEHCADSVARCKDARGVVAPPVTALYGGAQHPLDHHNLTPLQGQKVLVLADSDKSGRTFAKRLGKHLAEHLQADVRYLLPPGDDGYDIADAITHGGWKGVMDFVKRAGGAQDHDTVFPPDKTPAPILPMAETPYFRVAGFEGDSIVIQNKKTFRIHKIPASAISSEGHLIHLAPLRFWQAAAGGGDITAKHRRTLADAILRAAEDKGEISTQNVMMWRRGAHRTHRKRVVYHLGNCLLSPDDEGLMTVRSPLTEVTEDTSDIYLPDPPIELKDDPKALTYAQDLYYAIMSYRWEDSEDGYALVGWLVASLVGGALPFRPMVWLTAPPETGKTFVLEEILRPVFGSLVTDLANATEAGMASIASDSALPCYLDEFEPEKGRERRQQEILSLIRIATSGEAARIRGTASGGFTLSRPRFSLFMASVDRPTLTPANASRITSIRLGAKPVDDWPAVRDAIYEATTPERCLAIRTAIIRHTKWIVDHASTVENQLLKENVPTREAQIRAALSAGVAFLSQNPDFVIRRHAKQSVDIRSGFSS